MRRGEPLRRKAPLARTGQPLARSQLRARPRKPRSKAETAESLLWAQTIVARGCEVCSRRGEMCDGKLEGHHVVPQHTLKRRGLRHLLWDERNGFCACYRAHRRHTNRIQPIERRLLRPENETFAADHGLVDVLDRQYV